MSRSGALLRAALCAALLVMLAVPAARADTKVTSLRPWAEDNTYLVRVDLDGRTAPRLEPRASIDFLKAGQWVRITCQRTGESAYGSTVWDKVGPFYVPDHYIKTYTDGFIPGAPRCGATRPRPPPKRKRYVAMGDSYQSGEGAGGYLPAAPGRPYRCHRSINAYSQVLAARHRRSVVSSPRRDFVACSGAVIYDVTRNQLSALGRSVGVVTIGIGGNDVRFTDILKGCIFDPRQNCQAYLDQRFDLGTLRRRLDALYSQIRRRARKAVVIVVGYPRLFTERPTLSHWRVPRRACPAQPGRRPPRRGRRVRGAQARLPLRRSPRGVQSARLVLPRQQSLDQSLHEEEGALNGSFHPNAAGQQALADLIAAANPDVFR